MERSEWKNLIRTALRELSRDGELIGQLEDGVTVVVDAIEAQEKREAAVTRTAVAQAVRETLVAKTVPGAVTSSIVGQVVEVNTDTVQALTEAVMAVIQPGDAKPSTIIADATRTLEAAGIEPRDEPFDSREITGQ